MIIGILVILTLVMSVVPFAVENHVDLVCSKSVRLKNSRRPTSDAVAREILEKQGLEHVSVEIGDASRVNRYQHRKRILVLSDVVYGYSDLTAIGVAVHECGHAIQRKNRYIPSIIRDIAAPAAYFCSFLWIVAVVVGVALMTVEIYIVVIGGLTGFLAMSAISWCTLPIERNACRRAMEVLEAAEMLSEEEIAELRKVTQAMAMENSAIFCDSVHFMLTMIFDLRKRRRRW